MPAPKEVIKLIENFERNLDAYRSGKYNETQVRRDFIDPLFKALGWDMDNSAGYAEAYRDVIHEDAIKIGTSTKAPDYSFRVGGQRKFFLEAKKPSVNVKEDVEPAFQLRRYAWSAKLPLSIVTDFEEFAIYDCRAKPDKGDKASKARLFYCTFHDYADKWDEIAAIFSKEAVLKGSFDKYASTSKGKRGTTEVDSAFLEEIEGWRDLLARNIALRNTNPVGAGPARDMTIDRGQGPLLRDQGSALSQRELNFAVQQTIDRIIFLRICEDRGIEPYGRLMALQNGVNVYGRLREMFRDADDRYNSGLFHFKREKGRAEAPDELTLNLEIDDKPLKEIFKNLYYPDCPYEFSVLGADILGSVYEQFLGKVIRLTAGNRAVVEDKPEVKKAGGVFYTPAYIVQYIVAHTVGKLLEGKTPKQAAGIAILDPACGSGSFLIGAYQYLLDWYLARYVAEGAEKHSKGKDARLRHSTSGEWRLTTAEKKRILLEHIYGVDIDAQAVEVTKLSLLLKVLEGESDQTLTSQMKLFHERVLPDLEHNIQCGNSLIGPDFYDSQLDLDDETTQRINVFDWQAAFPQVFNSDVGAPPGRDSVHKRDSRAGHAPTTTHSPSGGFDVVIGNPPYVRQETLGAEFKHYARQHYTAYAGTADLYVYFIEQSHRLLRKGGCYGVICSNKFMRSNYGKPLRDYLATQTTLDRIVDFGELPVFQNAATFPAIILTRNTRTKRQQFDYAPIKRLDFGSLDDEVAATARSLDDRALAGENWTLADSGELDVLEKMRRAGMPLGEYANSEIYRGVLTGLNEAFVIDGDTRAALIRRDKKCAALIKPFVVGDHVRKYHIRPSDSWLILLPKGWTRAQMQQASPSETQAWAWLTARYSSLAEWLQPFADKARKRTDQGDYWWELRACDYYDKFEQPKIIYPEIAMASRFAFDGTAVVTNKTAFIIPRADKYLLGVLNSKLAWLFFKRVCSVLGDADKRGRLTMQTIYVRQLPIRVINQKNKQDRAAHDDIVKLVEKMLALHQQLAAAKTPQDTTLLQRQIVATDKQIDQLVYALYGLTEEEIALVEGA